MMIQKYACFPEKSKGRLNNEQESAYRDCFQRDKDRVIHSNSFRRLEYKTQVFINYECDYYRNRLTHTLEVVQIARSLACALGFNSELAEVISLCHDLGHTPFGHTGEDAINEKMSKYKNIFNHNMHSLRIITQLENKHPRFQGMNLSWECLEGVMKHNGPIDFISDQLIFEKDFFTGFYDLQLKKFSYGESQIAAISDDIAYNTHDIEDGLRAKIFSLNELKDSVPLVRECIKKIHAEFPRLEDSVVIYELIRRLMGYFINNVINNSNSIIKECNINDCEDIRDLGMATICFSDDAKKDMEDISRFLQEYLYKDSSILRVMGKCKKIIYGLFDMFMDNPVFLPKDWFLKTKSQPLEIIVCDYIAGMTDRMAVKEFKQLINVEW